MNKYIYVDHSATTQMKKEVFDEMKPYFIEQYGNPSSIYKLGRESNKAIENARQQIAQSIGCQKNEIYFVSGGSEANNMIIKGITRANMDKGNHIITSKIEHMAVLETCKQLEKEGFEVTYLNVDENGKISMKELEESIRPTTLLISIMFANNEIGTIQSIDEISKIANKNNIYFHTDAVQAIGTEYLNVSEMGITALSLSAHKIYGPKGIGVAYIKKGVKFETLINGGHQEKGKRAGTENVPAIVGFGKAIEIANRNREEYKKKLINLRDYCIEQIIKNIPKIKINGDMNDRLPGNLNISFEGIEGESLLLKLDMKGIYASSGSACTSGSLDPSHVLLAIGLPHEIAHGSLRITFGEENTKEDVDYIVENLIEIVNNLRAMSPVWNKMN